MASTLAPPIVAATRRQMIPAILTTPTAMIAQAAATVAPTARWPLANRGTTTRSTTWPSTHDWATIASAYTSAPTMAIANGMG